MASRVPLRLNVDVIVVLTSPAALAATAAIKTLPIVFATAIDPLGAGIVASLARLSGNVTSGALLYSELTTKRLELLKEAIPRLSRAAILREVPSRT